MESIDKRIKALGIQLPPVFRFPSKTRTGCVESRGILYLSGHGNGLPDWPDIAHRGKVGGDVSEATAYATARVVALLMLSSIVEKYGTLDRVRRVIRLLGMVNSAPDFLDHPKVINGYSELFAQVFGEDNGVGARSAVGLGPLPGNIAVEIEVIFELN